ncbi:hypothetical protein A0J61_00696 [Choanephora cucurbitarum]|uniref:Uncharacterized protein n=1 Tax=Choanephora cucurbitarum TaxID=101091 RepID=A0A1C7NQM4_9FUNG|nr:hypothetical protein A0J61_00696 [Choanephora cucurbitarum]
MTARPVNDDFSYRLTESILSQSPSPQPGMTPSHVGPLPSNAIVAQPQDNNASFNHYLGNHFKEDAPVLLDRLKAPHDRMPQKKQSESTFWTHFSNDHPGRNTTISSQHELMGENTWNHSGAFGPGGQHTYATATTFFSLGAFLFLFGFVFPPLWWIGSFYPVYIDERYQRRYDPNVKMAKRWRLLNRFFSLGFSAFLVVAIIVLAILYSI